MRSLFKRSIALLLFLALLLPYCNVLPEAKAADYLFYGEYTDVAVIKDSNSSPSMQGLAVGSQMMYAIKIQSDTGKSVITMTDKDTKTITTLKDAATGYSYFTGLGHANDMAVWGIDGKSHIFVTTTNKGANAIVRYRRESGQLYKVATYHMQSNGSDICVTAMDIMDVDSSGNIHLITKWGQDIYTGTVHKDTGNTTINMTKLCSIGKDLAYIKGEKLNLSEWTNQGMGYHDNTLFVPLSGPQSGANIALHRSLVLVYDLSQVTDDLKGCTIYPTDSIAFRVTSGAYSALFEIESVDICSSDLKLYFNTNRRVTDSDTNHDGISYFKGYTYTKPAKASFDNIKHFNAKYLPNGGTGTMAVQRINTGIGTALSANAYTKTGYQFVGWYAHRLAQNQWFYQYGTDRSNTKWYAEGSEADGYVKYIYNDKQKVAATSNVHADTVEFVAQWSPITYTVKFDGNGGTGSAISDLSFTVEQTKTLPANTFSKPGYSFKGWQISGQSTVLQPGTSAAELAKYVGTDSNITLVANWEANNYTVTWNVDGQKYATTTVTYGQPITAPSYTAPEGYNFSGWTVPATMPAKNITLDATTSLKTYTITWNVDGKTTTETYNYGDSPSYKGELNKAPNGHYSYTFTGWTPEITKVTGEATYTATYSQTENSYYILGDMNEWQVEEANKMTKNADGTYSVTMALSAGTYEYKANIGNWDICWPGSGNQTIQVPYDTDVIFTLNRDTGVLTADYVVKVILAGDFNEWNNTAFMTDNGDGTYTTELELPAGTYEFKIIDDAVWLGNNGTIEDITTKTSDTGWVMDQNQNNCKLVATGGTYTFTYNANTDSLVITNVPAEYTVTFLNDDGVELSKQTVSAGQMPTVPADPTKANNKCTVYTFSGWDNEVVIATGDATYTATYSEKIVHTEKIDAAVAPSCTETGLTEGKHCSVCGEVLVAQNVVSATGHGDKVSYTYNDDNHSATYDCCGATYVTNEPHNFENAEHKCVCGMVKLMTYTVTFTVNGEVYSKVEGVRYGDAIEAPAYMVPEGHTFSGWTLPDTMPAEDITLDATLTINSYKLIFKDSTGNVLSEEMVEYGTAIEYPATEKEGYTFDRWDSDAATMLASDLTITGTWTVNQYTITFMEDPYFDLDDGFSYSITKNYGEAITEADLTALTAALGTYYGYEFQCWETEDGEYTIPETMPAYDQKVTAYWDAQKYELKVYSSLNPTQQLGWTTTMRYDEYYITIETFNEINYFNYTDPNGEYPYLTPEGYVFTGYKFADGTDMVFPYTHKLLEDVNIYAQFAPINYTVTFMDGESEYAKVTTGYGTAITLPENPTKEGSTFAGWVDADGNAVDLSTMPMNDMTVYASWTVNSYTVTWLVEGGSIEETYEYGATVNGFIPEREYIDSETHLGWYDFLFWIDLSTNEEVTLPFTMPARDMEISNILSFNGWYERPGSESARYWHDSSIVKDSWFCVNENAELVTDGSGDWYYSSHDGFIKTGAVSVPYPTEAINGITYAPDQDDPDQENSMFLFDENGVFQSEYNGFYELDGKTVYAVNGELPWHVGLVEVNGEYYYFGDDRTMVKGQNLELSKTNDMVFDNGAAAVQSGTYTFDENGKLCKYHGIVRIDGKLYQYENYRLIGEVHAKLSFVSLSLNGNIAINYYMLLSDKVLADETAYMQFTMVDGEVVKIPVSQGIKTVYMDETYYTFSCTVNAKEMTDNIVSQFFYDGGSTSAYSYSVQTYAKRILTNSTNENMKALAKAMLDYGAASQIHFGYNTGNLANAGMEAPDYSGVNIEGFKAVANQGTDLAKLYSVSLILKSETMMRFIFKVDSSVENFTVTYNGQSLDVQQRSGLYYADVIGIAAKDLDEDVTVTINDGINTANVSFNPMAYCQVVQNDTTGSFGQDMKDVVASLYLYNQAANIYFKEK